jgi:hypothetical protein
MVMRYSNIIKAVMLSSCLMLLVSATCLAQLKELDQMNPIWKTQSKNASESMPCGGGDIGLNVWVEQGEVMIYLSQSGMFDENNALLKAGRLRLKLFPNPFNENFKQELILKDGAIKISGGNGLLATTLTIWVDVFHPVVHVDIASGTKINTVASYESWRQEDRILTRKENSANSWKWYNKVSVITQKDQIGFDKNAIIFYHQNKDSSVFDATIRQEGLLAYKDQFQNPLKGKLFGGLMKGENMVPVGRDSGTYAQTKFGAWQLKSKSPSNQAHLAVALNTVSNTSIGAFQNKLQQLVVTAFTNRNKQKQDTKNWWNQYWNRSYVFINSNKGNEDENWQLSRNYQLFRYMLGCNALGKSPTKFNGGLFTVDPIFTDSSVHGTPDHRNWGGGLHTAQNQRLVYWPMLKSGDADLMQSQFDFYLKALHNAELRTRIYWNHAGASFTEQLENFGLPNVTEYGWKRPAGIDPGLEANAWLEYCWDTSLEFCEMILQSKLYTGKNIKPYLQLIESCLIFFDEHYQWMAKQRGEQPLDARGKLLLYPGSATETFKLTTNANSTIAGLRTVTQSLLQTGLLDANKTAYFKGFLQRLPDLSFGNYQGHTTLAPAQKWERVNNVESPQLYPVFPWGIYGVGKPGLDTAINTWRYDTFAIKFRSHLGWKQDNIFAARLGLVEEAKKWNTLKLKNAERRFPAFWGPGFDWVPDHNWGGSGMIGLQEMLLQTNGRKIYLLPTWPKEWDTHFKLHAPYQTTVEGRVHGGKLVELIVLPKERMKDVVNLFH